jgi:hypothetical protein
MTKIKSTLPVFASCLTFRKNITSAAVDWNWQQEDSDGVRKPKKRNGNVAISPA